MTIGISILFIAIIIIAISSVETKNNGIAKLILTIVMSISIPLGSYGYSPRSYIISNKHLIIQRPFDKKIFDKNKIQSIKPIKKSDLKGTIRTFAVGGLFGYYGDFKNKKFGEMIWYVTNRNKIILIETINDKKILISPENNERFIKEMTDAISK